MYHGSYPSSADLSHNMGDWGTYPPPPLDTNETIRQRTKQSNTQKPLQTAQQWHRTRSPLLRLG